MLVFLYLLAVVLANLSVAHFGPSIAIINAFLFIGLDLTARDSLHSRWKNNHLIRNMFLLILAGSVLSWGLNKDAGQVALASFIAFFLSATSDTLIYSLLHDKSQYIKINGSNLVSSAVDSITFPAIAFGFPLLLGVMAGQFLAKVIGGFIWSFILRWLE